MPAHQHNLRGRQQSSSKPDQVLAIHKPPSPSVEAAAHLLPRCLLPPSGLHPAMQEEETPATKPVKGREEDWENWPRNAPRWQAHPTLHLGPLEGILRGPRMWRQNESEQLGLGPHGQQAPSPCSTWGSSQASPLHLDRTSPVPRESPGPAPRRDKVASTPQGGAKVSYPLAPRGPLSGREQEGELFQGDCSDLGPFSSPSASEPPPPCSSQGSASLPPKSRARDASPGALEPCAPRWGAGKRRKQQRGVC